MIEAKGLVKKFVNGVEITVLRGLDLTVKNGEFLAITGRSGSGKSTLMYQLSLLDEPTAGQIILDGVDTATLTPEAKTQFRLRKLGYIFQDYAILPELNTLENVMVPLLMQGLGRDQAREKSVLALQKVGLGTKLSNLPSQLSGGEQQRVSIARAVAHDPQIIFADEPTANLDSETSKMVLDTFIQLHREGQTILMVTHELEYAEMADRIVVLRDGLIVEERSGTYPHLDQKPAKI